MDEKTKAYLAQIRRRYPAFSVITARLNDQGQFNDGLILNEAFIFRFPKLPSALEQLHLEYEILLGIQDHVSLPVPDPICSNLDTKVLGEAFIGYRLIPGEPLYRENLAQIRNKDTLQDMARTIADFLRELHAIPVEEAFSGRLQQRDTRKEWANLFRRFEKKLLPTMQPSEQEPVRKNFRRFLDNERNFDYAPVLRHGDFGTVNLLYEPESGRITGVIDFGNAGLGDPALDFATLMAPFGYGMSFLQRVAYHYPVDEATLARARFYNSTFALQEALYKIERRQIGSSPADD